MKKLTALISLLLLFIVPSCCIKQFPLCLKMSQTKPSADAMERGIGKTLSEVCKEKHITITVLSDYAAEFKGTKKNMKWLQANYHILLCDFDECSTAISANDAVSCLSNAQSWIQIVQNSRHVDLMKDGTHYCPVCMPATSCY